MFLDLIFSGEPPSKEIGKKLGEKLDKEKLAGRPVRLVRSRTAAQGVKLLFKELVKYVVHNGLE